MTLRGLSTLTKVTLEEWMFIARRANLNVDADTELSAEQAEIVRMGCLKYLQQKQRAQRQEQAQKEQAQKEQAQKEQVQKAQAASEQNERRPAPDAGADVSDKDAAAAQTLERQVRKNEIFVDISSLVAPQSEKAWPKLIPVLKAYGRKLRMPVSVLKELSQYMEQTEDTERAALARNSMKVLRELQKEGLIDIRGSVDNDSKPAKDLLMSCAHFRMKYNLLVITQNVELTKDLIALNGQKSAAGMSISIKKFNEHGYLSNVIEYTSPPDKQEGEGKGGYHHTPDKHFRIEKEVRKEPDKLLQMTVVPAVGDEVYVTSDCRGPIRLTERCSEGGEGVIYFTNTEYVAKIYKPDRCSEYRREKISRIAAAKLSYNGICFPLEVLYNSAGEFVGYLMQKAQGHTLKNSVFRKQTLMKKFPGWKKADLVQLAITILYKINYIHENGLLLGDINPSNILVASPLEVYFVDTDSYQVNDLPCQVGVPEFTAPEMLQSQRNGEFKEYSEVLRTRASENFAVATLLFMIMMPGKHPYAHVGGSNPVENILTMHFPYALNERASDGAPEGVWRNTWSHLNYQTKVKFHQTFTKQEGKSEFNAKERLSVYQWIMEMRTYLSKLQRVQAAVDDYNAAIAAGQLHPKKDPPPEDEQDLWMYPTRMKWPRDKNTHTYNLKLCVGCNEWAPVQWMKMGYGYCCRSEGETIKCESCGEDFIYTDFDKNILKRKRPRQCRDCFQKGKEVVYEAECETPGCFNKVRLTQRELDFFEKEGLPKVCNICKDSDRAFGRYAARNRDNYRRSQSAAAQPKPAAAPVSRPAAQSTRPAAAAPRPAAPVTRPAAPAPKPAAPVTRPAAPAPKPAAPVTRPTAQPTRTVQPTRPTTPAPQKKTSSGSTGCFITTAVCDYYGKRDDCQELTDFRRFRDQWLRSQPGGEELVREYYACAPEIVRRMRESAEFGTICTEIWEQFLLPCQKMIHEGRMEDCRDHYCAMVEHLRLRLNCQ